MKTLLLSALALSFTFSAAQAREIDYVGSALGLPAVIALKKAFPVCKEVKVKTEMKDGMKQFVVSQACKVSRNVPDGTPNQDVVITITGSSAAWGELGGMVVSVGEFCEGNCEI